MSPGRVNPGSEARATLAARPMPNSCIPPHQTGTPRVQAEVVHSLCLAQAPHAADLDVDDPAGAQIEGLAGVISRVNALIKTDRRLQGRLQPGVVDDVVMRQRLFNQEEVEFVKRLKHGQIVQGVRRVGVDLQRDCQETARARVGRCRRPALARFST